MSLHMDINGLLSEEVLLNIFSFLSANELLTCSCVCKSWNRVTREESLWNWLLCSQYPLDSRKARADDERSLKASFLELARIERNWKNNKPRQITLEGHSESITCFEIVVDEKTNHTKIVSGSSDKYLLCYFSYMCRLMVVWDLGCDQYNILRTKVIDAEFNEGIRSIQYHAANKWIIASSEFATKVITMDGTVLASIEAEESGSAEFISTGDDYYIIRSAADIPTFTIWKMVQSSELWLCEPLDTEEQYSVTEIRELKIPGKSGMFVTGCSNSFVQIWNVQGILLATAGVEALGPVRKLAVSENLIAVGYYTHVWLFQCEISAENSVTLSPLIRFELTSFLTSMALEGTLSTGAVFASSCSAIVDIRKSTADWNITLQLKGHAGRVTAIKMDDMKIVTGSVDATVRVWNWKGECLSVFSGHMNLITKVDCKRNLLVSASGDGTLVVQNFDTITSAIPNPTELISTPEKLAKRIEQARTEKANNQSARLIVLVLTGAFSPIHRDHVRVLEHARKFMEDKGHIVLAGVLSPANDSYGKMGLIPAKHRLRMVELAVQDIDWLLVSKIECTHTKFCYPYEVLDHIEAYFKNQAHLDMDVAVMYLCGDDVPPRMTAYMDKVTSHGMVIVPRGGEEFLKELPNLTKYPQNIYVMDSWNPSKASSTQIRDRIQKQEGISDLTFEAVEKYIKENHLF